MEVDKVNSRLGHQGRQLGNRRSCASLRPRHTVHPVHKVQRFEAHMGSAVSKGRLEVIAHLAGGRKGQALF